MIDLLMIVGPTAVGKTLLSIELARKFSGEIINGDAMQFYQGLDIGTAKITESEMSGIKHHLLDFLEPGESFSVAEYQQLVRKTVEAIKKRGKLPIIVGGSGLYLSSIVDDYKFFGHKRDQALEEKYQDLSTDMLAKILIETKPKLAKNTDLSNRRRILRALSKEDNEVQETLTRYYDNPLIIGLKTERKKLYELIDQRVDNMIEKGLIDEAKKLFEKGIDLKTVQAIGYKELFPLFSEEMNLKNCLELIKRNSRRYAKRQMTWFKNKMQVRWLEVDLENFQNTVDAANEIIKREVI